MIYKDVEPTSNTTCVGGECAQTCPVFNLGGRCPSVVELLGLFRAGACINSGEELGRRHTKVA